MAMSFAVLVLLAVKHVAGMRGHAQAEWLKDGCAQFGAEQKSWWSNTCQCPKERPVPRNCEGRSDRTFDPKKTIEEGSSDCHCEDPCEKFGAKFGTESDWCNCPDDRPRATKECGSGVGGLFHDFRHSKASKGCRCVTEVEAAERLKMPVAASALRFCSALVGQSYKSNIMPVQGWDWDSLKTMTSIIEDALNKTSPEICQHALAGTINKTEAERAPFAEKASELSRHGSDEDEDGDLRYGRMRSVKEDATDPAEKALWEHALSQVCKDECTDLLNMMKNETEHLADDVIQNHTPFAQSCAEHVVQHVEAEVLGCCARSCGFDGRRCVLWPFFSPQEKVEWELECCAEMSILKNSSRELMCNSVLPGRLAKEASQYDLEEEDGTDVGKVLIGQNATLFWTQKGAQESALGKEAKAHEGKKVNLEFLIKHKKIGEEYLHLGYFREEPLSKMFDEATSVMEGNFQNDTCNFGKLQQQCPKKFHDTYMKKCKQSWQLKQRLEDSEETFRQLITHPGEGNCTESDPQLFATPEDCEKLAKNSGEIFLHYFTYDTENMETPIKCFSLSKKQCTQKGKWWTNITLVSVQELVEDVNTYTELVYVKVNSSFQMV